VELPLIWRQPDNTQTWNGIPLGAPGDGSRLVLLATIALEDVCGGTVVQTPAAELLLNVGGVTYAVELAIIKLQGSPEHQIAVVGLDASTGAPGPGPTPSGAVNEVQRFDIAGNPGSGTFTLAFNGSEPTASINHHPAAGDVQRALEALSTIGAGNVTVSKDGNWGYVCAFCNALGNQDLPEITAASQLGGGATITVSTVTQGSGG
jgi:hypothetical protein